MADIHYAHNKCIIKGNGFGHPYPSEHSDRDLWLKLGGSFPLDSGNLCPLVCQGELKSTHNIMVFFKVTVFAK